MSHGCREYELLSVMSCTHVSHDCREYESLLMMACTHVSHDCREYESLSKTCDKLKAKFTEYECQDTRCRENLKHARAKAKKLNGTLVAETKKVSKSTTCFSHAGYHLKCLLEVLYNSVTFVSIEI